MIWFGNMDGGRQVGGRTNSNPALEFQKLFFCFNILFLKSTISHNLKQIAAFLIYSCYIHEFSTVNKVKRCYFLFYNEILIYVKNHSNFKD
ncbi:hypothetical protein LDENG_00126080 [Lucifuga dentata]|nr:hypothetical protein LDENG_00126080 [Lucifuga dentata]